MKYSNLFAKLRQSAPVLGALLGIQFAASAQGAAALLGLDHPQVKAAIAAQSDVTPGLMSLPGVLGTAVGAGDNDSAVVVVYVDKSSPSRADLIRSLPPQVRGVGVKVHLTDAFQAFGNTSKQSLPIQLGTSGGWVYDRTLRYCCGGTLGSLITFNGVQYIMSNYHVLEGDITSGGNGRIAATGDPVIHPGLIDLGCSTANSVSVGSLRKLSSLPNSNVDVAIATVTSSANVTNNGTILGIGTISATTLAPSLNLGVKKSGRTSGLTFSSISGLNASISVSYSKECGGSRAFTKTFTGQIVINNPSSAFLQGGDSGSLMVENAASNPKAVGLLYAGSSTSAIANPINEVLTFVGTKLNNNQPATATMVGN